MGVLGLVTDEMDSNGNGDCMLLLLHRVLKCNILCSLFALQIRTILRAYALHFLICYSMSLGQNHCPF